MEYNITMEEKHTAKISDFFYSHNETFSNTTEIWKEIKNLTGFEEYENDLLYDVPAGLIALLSVFYGSISILAVVGNSLVMWIVATSRRMQNVTNCFIANLALADIVIGLFAIPFQFQAALLQRWNLPYFMCSFCPFVQVLSVNVSVFTLTAIAVDRHRAILNPLGAKPSKKIAKIIIGGIWILAGAISIPMAFSVKVVMVEEMDPKTHIIYEKPFCALNFSVFNENSLMIYRMIIFFLQYLTPLCIITFVYVRMALKLWGSRAPGNAQDSRDANLMKNKKKVIKMLVIVVALFAICWLPLQTYQVLQMCFPVINDYKYINIIFFCCDWLAMSNSCYNPFIYGIYNEKFKREFKQRFPCCRGGWSPNAQNDSIDLDKNNSIIHTRHTSLRSNSEWRRSTRQTTQCHHNNSNRCNTHLHTSVNRRACHHTDNSNNNTNKGRHLVLRGPSFNHKNNAESLFDDRREAAHCLNRPLLSIDEPSPHTKPCISGEMQHNASELYVFHKNKNRDDPDCHMKKHLNEYSL